MEEKIIEEYVKKPFNKQAPQNKKNKQTQQQKQSEEKILQDPQGDKKDLDKQNLNSDENALQSQNPEIQVKNQQYQQCTKDAENRQKNSNSQKENDVIKQEVLPPQKRGNKLQSHGEKQEEKNEQINYQQSLFENSNEQLENIEIKQEELKVYIKKPLLDYGSSNIKNKLNAKEKQTLIKSNKLQKKKSTEDPDEIEVKDKQNLKQSSDEQNEQQNQEEEGNTRYDLLMQQVIYPQKQVDKKLLEEQNQQIDQKQQFLENISKDQQYFKNMMKKDQKPTNTQSNVQQFQYQNNTQPKQIIMTKQDHASRSQKDHEQDVYLQDQKQLPQDLEIEEQKKQYFDQAIYEENNEFNQEGNTKNDLIVQQFKLPQKFDQNLQADKKQEEQKIQIDQKYWFESISKDHEHFKNLMKKNLKPTTTQSKVQQNYDQNNTQAKQIITIKQEHVSRSQKDHEQNVYLKDQKYLPQDLEIKEQNKKHLEQPSYEENVQKNKGGNTRDDEEFSFKSPHQFHQNLLAGKQQQEEQNMLTDEQQEYLELFKTKYQHIISLNMLQIPKYIPQNLIPYSSLPKPTNFRNSQITNFIGQKMEANNQLQQESIKQINQKQQFENRNKSFENNENMQIKAKIRSIIDNSRKNINQNISIKDPLIEEQIEEQEQLEQQYQLYLKQARIYENRQKNIQAKKKYDIQQEMIPSQKIGQKLESFKQKQNELNQQINQKQLYFENRKEQFQYQEKLIQKLEKSFHTNQSSFNTIWESSKYNLKVQVGNIYKNTLKEIQVKLSEKEVKIVLKNQNQLVIGRSGTGKTTTAAVKLSSMQMGHDMAQKDNFLSESSEKLRICFTTISNYLTLDVENFFNRIMDKKQLRTFSKPNTLSQVQRWPHFTNIKELILQIDGNLAVPFIQRDMEGKIIQAQSMEINLENRLIVKLRDEIEGRNQYSEIGIRQFVEEFWLSNKSKFDKLKVDPYVAYSQINSYITGNQMSYKSENNMISEEKYLNLIGKSKIDLDKQQKMNIYQICQQYQKWKHEKKYFDLNDIVNYIIKNIVDGYYDSENGYFHYLFVDEVQDLNCACLYLLCLLTEQNLYIGGDTAQTISQENCFKFTDLKALFSENNREIDYQVNKALSSDLHETQLTQNFRSHGQIIELNNAIVNLLEIFFPTSLDHLIPEISLNKGPKPILINKREHLYKFLSQDTEVNENVDYFGRLQVYIVKNQDEKEILKQTLLQEGKKGQIFTVLESKGLEFQDVIAYKLLSSSYNSTKCWNALNLLDISEQKISIKDFQLKYHCQLQEEFEGSTFSRQKGSDHVIMKDISKKRNADAQIKREYSKDFNKLINELKNIYVAFSRARSRIFIYEEEIFVGKQIKNPIIKLLEDLKIVIDQELNEELIEKIKKEHLDYIEKHEPIKNNKQQFISMAQILTERKQFLEAAYYYEVIGDELNRRICIGKNLIFQTLRKIEDKKEQFEKERKQMLQGQVEIKQLMLYQSIKNQFIEAIENLKGSQEFELIAQIYYKLGMYEEAVQYYQQFKDFLQSSPNFSQDKSKIKEIDSNIKQIYFEKANILEMNSNNQQALEQNYKELESFIEKAGIQDTKVQLYLSFRLNNYDKLFNNLIKFKENDLIEKKDLIHILHYYYPKILEQKLEQIMLINTNEGGKQKLLQGPKTALGQVLIELIQQVIIPFKDEFVRIAKSRQNMEFFQEQLQYFNQLSNTHQLKQLDQEQKYLNGDYLMLFYVMLIQFDCSKQQKKFNDILQQQELSHQIFIDQILQNRNQPKIIKNILDEMKQLPWLQSGKVEKQISPDYQYYYAYLGLYDQLKSRNLVGCSQDNHKYLNFTFQLKSFDQFQQLDDLYNQIYYIQRVIVHGQLSLMGSIQKQDMISQYKQINRFFNISAQQDIDNKFLYLKFLKQTVNDIVDMINQKQINQTSAIKKFISCQDLFLSFFLCLQKLKVFNMFQLDNEFIIKFIDLTKFFFNFNYQFLESSLYGEFNGIFQDAFCSCFGFISPFLPGQSIFDKEFKYTWQLLGYSDYYLINIDNPYLDKSIIGEDKLISPILSPEFSKIKIIEKKTAMMLSKKQFGQYCTEFMKRYSEFLINKTYEANYYQQDPQKKIIYPFQILYLNKCLQQMIQNIDQQILILEQNIPKNHTRQHEIESIKNLIDQIENSDQIKQNEQKIQNLKKLYKNKLNSQKRDTQQIKIIKKEIRLLDDNRIYKCKSNIIQSGLVINKILHSKSVEEDRNQILQYLLDEASNLLALILNKIEQKDNQNEIEQSFENFKKQFEDQQTKYKKQYEQQYSITQHQNQDQNLFTNKLEQNTSSEKQEKDLAEFMIQLQAQQSKEPGEKQKEEEKEDEDEEIQNEGENILQSCDDILYAFTILNMCDQRPVIKDLFIGLEKNQLTQFTQLCYQFFESRNSYDRINIGLLSNQLLLMFRENINYFTQINIFQIGLAEIYLQLNFFEGPEKVAKTKVCIPSGFGNCFSFNTTNNEQLQIKVNTYSIDINYNQIYLYINQVLDLVATIKLKREFLVPIFNMVLQILILFLKKQTEIIYQIDFSKKIHKFLRYFSKKIGFLKKNQNTPFKDVKDYTESSQSAYFESDDKVKQDLYKEFSQRFHKTFLYLAEKAATPLSKENKNQVIGYDLIQFIQSIRYSEIQFILINHNNEKNIYCELQFIKLQKQIELKDSKLQDDYEQIKSKINTIKNNLNQNNTDELNEQKCINIFYKQDFTIFMSQVVYSYQPTYCIFDSQIQQQLQKFEDDFLKTIIQIQKVRKIFLQELSLNKFSSSEKYIYIIQKLNSIAKQEKEFYRQMIQTEQLIIENSQEFQQKLEQNSIEYINLMEKVYSDYLHYITEPFEKIEKESLDIQKFIEEQINTKN
ncbi:hypothetical protein ABPG74_017393 [Tetrahymena malaccensis]